MTRKKKFIIGLLSFFLFIFIILVSVLSYFAAGILDSKPSKKDVWENHTPEKIFEMVQMMNTVNTKMYYATKPDEMEMLILTEDDVNAIILLAANQEDMTAVIKPEGASKLPEKEYSLLLKDGVFYLKYSYELPFWTPFGSFVNAEASFIPEISKNDQKVKILSAKVGDFDLPPDFSAKKAEEYLNAFKNGGNLGIKPEEVVEQIQLKHKMMIIKYYPFGLKQAMINYTAVKAGNTIELEEDTKEAAD